MSHLQYFAYKGMGEFFQKNFHYSTAVRVGDRIEISGQGGWDRETGAVVEDLDGQIDKAFENVDFVLKHAGGKGFAEVFRITTYSVAFTEAHQNAIVRNLKKWMPDHQPLWTELGVEKLGLPEMKIEIEVVAHVPGKETSGDGSSGA